MHDMFRLAYVTPIHKGGSKMNPANYKPVSLTSHIMKIFERVIKMPIIEHLESRGLVRPNQHGFVEGELGRFMSPPPLWGKLTVFFLKVIGYTSCHHLYPVNFLP